MDDENFILAKVRELQRIIHEIQSESMHLPEQFLVASTIYKLLPSWKESCEVCVQSKYDKKNSC